MIDKFFKYSDLEGSILDTFEFAQLQSTIFHTKLTKFSGQMQGEYTAPDKLRCGFF